MKPVLPVPRCLPLHIMQHVGIVLQREYIILLFGNPESNITTKIIPGKSTGRGVNISWMQIPRSLLSREINQV